MYQDRFQRLQVDYYKNPQNFDCQQFEILSHELRNWITKGLEAKKEGVGVYRESRLSRDAQVRVPRSDSFITEGMRNGAWCCYLAKRSHGNIKPGSLH
ncbi:Uncharacterised protein [Legionella lansingensis]|nr:Uncharacterised protein [Legionella lansingensis]